MGKHSGSQQGGGHAPLGAHARESHEQATHQVRTRAGLLVLKMSHFSPSSESERDVPTAQRRSSSDSRARSCRVLHPSSLSSSSLAERRVDR